MRIRGFSPKNLTVRVSVTVDLEGIDNLLIRYPAKKREKIKQKLEEKVNTLAEIFAKLIASSILTHPFMNVFFGLFERRMNEIGGEQLAIINRYETGEDPNTYLGEYKVDKSETESDIFSDYINNSSIVDKLDE